MPMLTCVMQSSESIGQVEGSFNRVRRHQEVNRGVSNEERGKIQSSLSFSRDEMMMKKGLKWSSDWIGRDGKVLPFS